jgi:ribosomal protein S18 acetylase RimI-like enzyme
LTQALVEMNLSIRTADSSELAASESLSCLNMSSYRSARCIAWDPRRFRLSWGQFENLAIVHGSQCCGFIRLLPEGEALAIRDLQIDPRFQGKGIGTWAIVQVKGMARARGYNVLRLRVYPENPAMALYARLGFCVERVEDAVVHMRCYLPTDPTEPE